MSDLEYILERLTHEELLAQLAEETAELGKAALKLRRVIDGRNPTPVSLSAAFENFEEEIADVLLCLETLGFDHDGLTKYRHITSVKLARWRSRLEAKEQQEGSADG